MPFASNNGTRIYYRSKAVMGGGSNARVPLVLAHGFMQQSDDWTDAGYVDRLSQFRPLVLLDFRGHGQSDKPHSVADYRMELLVDDLNAVLDQLGAATVDFMGYSFGAWVGFGMASFAPERLRSLVLGGMHPYIRDPGPLQRRIDRFVSTRDALAAGGGTGAATAARGKGTGAFRGQPPRASIDSLVRTRTAGPNRLNRGEGHHGSSERGPPAGDPGRTGDVLRSRRDGPRGD